MTSPERVLGLASVVLLAGISLVAPDAARATVIFSQTLDQTAVGLIKAVPPIVRHSSPSGSGCMIGDLGVARRRFPGSPSTLQRRSAEAPIGPPIRARRDTGLSRTPRHLRSPT